MHLVGLEDPFFLTVPDPRKPFDCLTEFWFLLWLGCRGIFGVSALHCKWSPTTRTLYIGCHFTLGLSGAIYIYFAECKPSGGREHDLADIIVLALTFSFIRGMSRREDRDLFRRVVMKRLSSYFTGRHEKWFVWQAVRGSSHSSDADWLTRISWNCRVRLRYDRSPFDNFGWPDFIPASLITVVIAMLLGGMCTSSLRKENDSPL